MKPTQAQIEAAADAIASHPNFDGSPDEYKSVAQAALTAAAEAGEQTKDDWLRRESDLIAQIERATIERCAQVAAGLAHINGEAGRHTQNQIAAAIRAQKDKP